MIIYDVIFMHALRRANIYHREVLHMNLRTKYVYIIRFNLNSFSTNQCLKDFSFKKAEVGRIIDKMGWSSITRRTPYCYYEVTATFLFMQRLEITVR